MQFEHSQIWGRFRAYLQYRLILDTLNLCCQLSYVVSLWCSYLY